MKTEEAALLAKRWNETNNSFQTEIFARMPIEFVYMYRVVCKQWNDLLSSNHFITRWAEAPINRKQPRLVLCDRNPKMPCMAFCFYTRTWIKSCFTFSFLDDWIPQICRSYKGIYCIQSAAGLILVRQIRPKTSCSRVCNPYTRTFVEIPTPPVEPCIECIVVDQNDTRRLDTAYKVIAVGSVWSYEDEMRERHTVALFEPSQKTWNTVKYIPEDLIMHLDGELFFSNGSFYAFCEIAADKTNGIVGFTISLEGNGSGVAPMPIPFLFAPLPEIVQTRNRFEKQYVLPGPQIITCGSRLLLIADKWMRSELVIIVWEFKTDGPILSDSQSWEWVEITRMPSFLSNEWMYKLWSNDRNGYFQNCCIGVGDHVCFIPSPYMAKSKSIEVVHYNLIDNTWNWLPSSPTSHACVGEKHCHGGFYKTIAFEPSPHVKFQ